MGLKVGFVLKVDEGCRLEGLINCIQGKEHHIDTLEPRETLSTLKHSRPCENGRQLLRLVGLAKEENSFLIGPLKLA